MLVALEPVALRGSWGPFCHISAGGRARMNAPPQKPFSQAHLYCEAESERIGGAGPTTPMDKESSED